MLLLRAADSLSEAAKARLKKAFATDDPTWKLKAAWDVKEQVRTLLRNGSLEDAKLAKDQGVCARVPTTHDRDNPCAGADTPHLLRQTHTADAEYVMPGGFHVRRRFAAFDE